MQRAAVSFSRWPLQASPMEVPITLRRWFVAHFAVNLALGLPLLVYPAPLLRLLGWTTVDGSATRLAGAAFLAIGAQAYLGRDGDLASFERTLNLNVIWSFLAILALMLSIGEGAPPAVWALLSLFIALAGVWTHYRIRFKQLAAAHALDESQPQDED
jgi:hypothetical protein